MNLTSFDFIIKTVSENSISTNSAGLYQIDLMAKFYNLFLLYFYFQIMIFVVSVVRRSIRKNNKFDKG